MNETTNPNDEMVLELDFKFNAPIELVFDALTQPEHLKQWYCPTNMDVTFAESDARVGGDYRIGMTLKEGDGTEMLFIGKYMEMSKPNLIVFTQAFSGGKDAPLTPETTITIKLKQDGGKTFVNFNQSGFGNKRAFAGARASWHAIYEKLDKYIQTVGDGNL